MNRLTVCVVGVGVLGTLYVLAAASPAIGTATATGSFAVNQSAVTGKATLFDGAVVETAKSSSRVDLSNGSRIELNANSSLLVNGTQAVLQKGSGQFVGLGSYNLRARTLRIEPTGPSAVAQVRLTGERNVEVAALAGSVRVFSANGILVALLDPRMMNTFDPYAASPEAFDTNGCLLFHPDGKQFGLVVDNQIYQLAGGSLAGNVGNRVHVAGNTGTGAMQGVAGLVTVTSVQLSDVGGCVAAAGRFPGWSAQGPGGTVAAAAPKRTHTGAIIAGVAVAGGGGAIAAVALSGKSK